MEVGDSTSQALNTHTKLILPWMRSSQGGPGLLISIYTRPQMVVCYICVYVDEKASIPEVSHLSPEARKKERETRREQDRDGWRETEREGQARPTGRRERCCQW